MLAVKGLAGVAPEVNVREGASCIPLPSANKAAHSGLKSTGDVTRSPKQGYQWPHNEMCMINVHVNLKYYKYLLLKKYDW